MNKICEKKNMTGKEEFSRFSSLLNKTKNLKEKNAKINRRKHLYSFFFAYESFKMKSGRNCWNIFLLGCKTSCVV